MNGYNANGYKQYKDQAIYTMTKSELLDLVYCELLKRMTRAELSWKEEQIDIFDQSITRSIEIVRYLISTLDFKYPISQELSKMYQFFLYELTRVQASRKVEILQEIRPLVIDLRESFSEAGKRCGY